MNNVESFAKGNINNVESFAKGNINNVESFAKGNINNVERFAKGSNYFLCNHNSYRFPKMFLVLKLFW